MGKTQNSAFKKLSTYYGNTTGTGKGPVMRNLGSRFSGGRGVWRAVRLPDTPGRGRSHQLVFQLEEKSQTHLCRQLTLKET